MLEGSQQQSQKLRYRITGDASANPIAAHDEVLDRDVLIMTAATGEADRLVQAARRLASLKHAGIVGVHDVVCDEHGARLVMSHSEGISLSAAIADAREGLVRPELADGAAALGLMVRVCDAVARAHDSGTAHRELRTSVITIGRHGEMVIGGWLSVAEELHGKDDLHADIRALGACIFEVLVLRPPTPGSDPFSDLTSAEEARLPNGTKRLVRRALATDITNGYRGVGELRSDLARLCSQLRVAAAEASAPPWISRRTRQVVLVSALAIALGITGSLVWRSWNERVAASSTQTWDPPIAREDFADDGWRARWRAPVAEMGSMWQVRDGRLVSTASEEALLVFRERLSVPVAIEYTGQILPGERPGDLSVVWSEDETPDQGSATSGTTPRPSRSYRLQAAAYENSYCAITSDPGNQRLAYAPLQLSVAQDHRIRIEIDADRMSLAIDGTIVVEHRERFATTSGHISLYGHFPGKAFDDVTIQGRPLAAQVSALAMGDVLFTYGHFADAAIVYGRLAEGGLAAPVVQEALFRRGLAERRSGQIDASRETWSHLIDPALAQTADAIRLEELLDTGQDELFRDRLASAWRRSSTAHDELRRQWQIAAGRLIAAQQVDRERAEALLRLRENLFPGDATSGYQVANLLLKLGRFEQLLKEHPQERRFGVAALMALGRPDEAERAGWLVPMDRVYLYLMRGDYAKLASESGLPGYFAAVALCKSGRAAEVRGTYEGHPAKLYLGRASELLNDPNAASGIINEALMVLGRFEEAAGGGIPNHPGSGQDAVAMAMLGRIPMAEARLGKALPELRLIAALESGDLIEAKRQRAAIAPLLDRSGSSGWFPSMVLAPFADRLAGNDTAFDHALQSMADGWKGVYAERARIFAGAALGKLDDAAVLAQPTASEAKAWLALAQALRAEREGHQADARIAYAAFTALPMSQRLLSENTPDPAIELFVAWRLRALGR